MIRPSRTRRLLWSAPLAALILVVLTGSANAGPKTAAITPPPANATFDYQIGGAYPPPSGVTVVSRDRTADPTPDTYSICYVNAYQTQPDEFGWWQDNHDDLLLRDSNGDYVVDGEWGETLLDTSTAAKRAALATIVDDWIDGCAEDGFRAVEPDNLDSWTRSDDLLSRADALSYARLLTTHAHQRGLAIAQKNTAQVADVGRDTGFDFAVAEECADYSECDRYTAAYGDQVIVIEYDRANFTLACTDWSERLSVVLRDRPVSTPDSDTYVYDAC